MLPGAVHDPECYYFVTKSKCFLQKYFAHRELCETPSLDFDQAWSCRWPILAWTGGVCAQVPCLSSPVELGSGYRIFLHWRLEMRSDPACAGGVAPGKCTK